MSAPVPFQIVDDGSPALVARRAVHAGTGLGELDLVLEGCHRVTAGVPCRVNLVAVNRGKADLWLGASYALRIKRGASEQVDGSGPRPSGPLRLAAGERRALGGWSFDDETPGHYVLAGLYTAGDGSRTVTSAELGLDVVAK